MTTPIDAYPFATQDGKAIPLDILRPSGLYRLATGSLITLPEGSEVAAIHAIGGSALLGFGGSIPPELVLETYYPQALFVPAEGTVIVRVPDLVVSVSASAATTVYVQLIAKWAGLALPAQYAKK